MKVAWQAAPGNVLQYRIAFKPAEGGEKKEIAVKGDTTQALLKNLKPATEYELFVTARYSSGLGDPLLGTGTTLEGKGGSHSTNVLEPLKHDVWQKCEALLYGCGLERQETSEIQACMFRKTLSLISIYEFKCCIV